jgi:hypothetical protein
MSGVSPPMRAVIPPPPPYSALTDRALIIEIKSMTVLMAIRLMVTYP